MIVELDISKKRHLDVEVKKYNRWFCKEDNIVFDTSSCFGCVDDDDQQSFNCRWTGT